MFRKAFILVSILMLSLTAACSGQVASVLGSNPSSTTNNPITDSSQMTLKDKLANRHLKPGWERPTHFNRSGRDFAAAMAGCAEFGL